MPIYNCSNTAVWLSLLLRWWWYKINYNDELFGGMATWEKSRKSYSQKQLPDVFYKKGVLKNFAKFIGKHLCQSLSFNKFAGLRPAALLKERLWYKCFPVNFAKFLRTPFFTKHLWTTVSVFIAEIVARCFHHWKSLKRCKGK